MKNNLIEKLSVIIAFKNENSELITTFSEIRSTIGSSIEIIVIDDASEDNFDYESNLVYYNVHYLKNNVRLGCGSSRDIGVSFCKTPYFFIIDAHMRFYDSQWAHKLVRSIDENQRAICCCKCKSIDYDTKQELGLSLGYGAYMNILDLRSRDILGLKWIKSDAMDTNQLYVDIPCVLGACYAASKEYWQYLKGLDGLRFYSCDEQYISIKVWREGGTCKVITDIEIGHLFRNKAPYEILDTEFFYNKLLIIHTLLPKGMKPNLIKAMKAMNYAEYVRASQVYIENEEEINKLSAYYKEFFRVGFDAFTKINEHYRQVYNFRQPLSL